MGSACECWGSPGSDKQNGFPSGIPGCSFSPLCWRNPPCWGKRTIQNHHKHNPGPFRGVLAHVPSADSLASVTLKSSVTSPLSNFLLHEDTGLCKDPLPAKRPGTWARILPLCRRFESESKIGPFSLVVFSVPFHLETLWFGSGFGKGDSSRCSDPLGNAQSPPLHWNSSSWLCLESSVCSVEFRHEMYAAPTEKTEGWVFLSAQAGLLSPLIPPSGLSWAEPIPLLTCTWHH